MSGESIFLAPEDRVIYLNRRRDSAAIVVAGDALPFPKKVLPMIAADKYHSIGREVAWMGYPSVAYPNLCFFRGAISAYLQDEECYLVDGVAINGVSGGPLFGLYVNDDESIKLLGSVSAYMPNRVSGGTLPGLLRAQDIAPFHKIIVKLKDFEEAKESAEQTNEPPSVSIAVEPKSPPATTTPEPPPSATPSEK
jgi:hypothetical protein